MPDKKALNALVSLKENYINKFGTLPIYVVAKDCDSYLTMSTLSKSFDKVVARAEIEKCGLHSLRHTFASLLFKKGIDVKIISEILGHSNYSLKLSTM